MSIKRSRVASGNRGRDAGLGRYEELQRKPQDVRTYTWEAAVAPQADEAFVAYSPACKLEQDALVYHVKFGKGVVTGVQGTKIDVLFQDGAKMLAHNPAGAAPAKAVVPPSSVPPG